MPNWNENEVEYNQISCDWRHRDSLTWQIPSVLVVVGGALIAAAFGLNLDREYIIRPLLLGFGTLFSTMISIALVRNLWYQMGSEKALERLLNDKGEDIPRAEGKVRRALSPTDFGVSKRRFIRQTFSGLTGSTLLVGLCFLMTISLFGLFISVIISVM